MALLMTYSGGCAAVTPKIIGHCPLMDKSRNVGEGKESKCDFALACTIQAAKLLARHPCHHTFTDDNRLQGIIPISHFHSTI